MTPKEQVLAFVRAKNPQTMELKFGCKLSFDIQVPVDNWETLTWRIVEMCRDNSEEGEFNNVAVVEDYGGEGYAKDMVVLEISQEELEEYEIIGSDMGLQELLIAANSVKKHHGTVEYREDGAWFFFYEHDPDLFISRLECCAWIDLTKDLHNQSDDFYSSLLPLLS